MSNHCENIVRRLTEKNFKGSNNKTLFSNPITISSLISKYLKINLKINLTIN